MPESQSGAVHFLGCDTIICIDVAGDFGVCHASCHEGAAAKPCTNWVAAALRTPVSFPERKRQAQVGARKWPIGKVTAGWPGRGCICRNGNDLKWVSITQ